MGNPILSQIAQASAVLAPSNTYQVVRRDLSDCAAAPLEIRVPGRFLRVLNCARGTAGEVRIHIDNPQKEFGIPIRTGALIRWPARWQKLYISTDVPTAGPILLFVSDGDADVSAPAPLVTRDSTDALHEVSRLDAALPVELRDVLTGTDLIVRDGSNTPTGIAAASYITETEFLDQSIAAGATFTSAVIDCQGFAIPVIGVHCDANINFQIDVDWCHSAAFAAARTISSVWTAAGVKTDATTSSARVFARYLKIRVKNNDAAAHNFYGILRLQGQS